MGRYLLQTKAVPKEDSVLLRLAEPGRREMADKNPELSKKPLIKEDHSNHTDINIDVDIDVDIWLEKGLY